MTGTKPIEFESTCHRVPRLRLCTFGPLEICLDGVVLGHDRWESANSRLLLVYLLLRGGTVSQQSLAKVFWPGSPRQKGHRSLITTIYRVRKALGDTDLVVRAGEGYGFSGDCSYELDVEQFQELFRRVQDCLCSGDSQSSVTAFRQLRVLYRGDFLEEFQDEWCSKFADCLRRRYVTAMVMAAGQLLSSNLSEALEWAVEATQVGVTDEKAWALLMKVHALSGNRRQLEKTLQDAHSATRQEPGFEPSHFLRNTFRESLAILR